VIGLKIRNMAEALSSSKIMIGMMGIGLMECHKGREE